MRRQPDANRHRRAVSEQGFQRGGRLVGAGARSQCERLSAKAKIEAERKAAATSGDRRRACTFGEALSRPIRPRARGRSRKAGGCATRPSTNLSRTSGLQSVRRAQPEKAEQERAAKNEAEQFFAELNRDNCVVLDGARTRVLRFEEVEHDAGGEHYVYRVATFLRFEDFRNLYLNRRIVVDDRSRDVGNWWLHHPQRRQYDGIIFKPAGEPIIKGKLNLWRGWGVTPTRGEWDLMREHIYEVLAARDDDVDAYIINWMAWAAQHPSEQAEVALVFIGDRGSGRGTLGKVLCKLFGQHARHISSPAHLTGRIQRPHAAMLAFVRR